MLIGKFVRTVFDTLTSNAFLHNDIAAVDICRFHISTIRAFGFDYGRTPEADVAFNAADSHAAQSDVMFGADFLRQKYLHFHNCI